MAYEFSCRDAGHTCGWHGKAGTEDELIGKMARHVKDKHAVKQVTNTIVNFLQLKIRRT